MSNQQRNRKQCTPAFVCLYLHSTLILCMVSTHLWYSALIDLPNKQQGYALLLFFILLSKGILSQGLIIPYSIIRFTSCRNPLMRTIVCPTDAPKELWAIQERNLRSNDAHQNSENLSQGLILFITERIVHVIIPDQPISHWVYPILGHRHPIKSN